VTGITIVTAFYDIGRGGWTQSMEQRGGPLPHYLERSNETYIERFKHLLNLDNEIIVFTSPDLAPTLRELATDKANLIVAEYDLINEQAERRAAIRAVMDDPDFPGKINPHQIRNPEYWCEDYVLVTGNKAFFVEEAIRRDLVSGTLVSWLDFGYCRTAETLNGKTTWAYDFDPTKIHLWNCQIPQIDRSNEHIIHAVTNNSVVIFGAMVVAHRAYWKSMETAMSQSLDILIQNGLVDDDQGLWLMCYFGNPDAFELHPLDYNDPFVVFRDYNN
jgi:protein YibB